MDIVRELPYISLPGVVPLNNWHLNNHSLHLTYKGHIVKDEYQVWFNEIVMTHYCKGGTILFLVLAHEPPDQIHPYEHTHVVIQTINAPLRSTDPLVLHWRRLPREPARRSQVPPYVRILQTPTHIKEARHHLSIQDPANILLREEGRVIPMIAIRRAVNIEVPEDKWKNIPVILRVPLNPFIRVQSLMRWQIDVLAIMNTRTEKKISLEGSRTIHVVYDADGGAGKMALFKALLHSEPSRFVVTYRVPILSEFTAHLREVRNSTWNGDCVIVNSNRWEVHDRIDEIADYLADISNELSCPNIWFFTNRIPKMRDTSVEWKKYKISGNWPQRTLSFLQPLSSD